LQTELTRLADTAAGTQRTTRVAAVSGAASALRQALAADIALRSGADGTTTSEADLAESRTVAQTRSDALRAAIENRPDLAQPPAAGAAPP